MSALNGAQPGLAAEAPEPDHVPVLVEVHAGFERAHQPYREQGGNVLPDHDEASDAVAARESHGTYATPTGVTEPPTPEGVGTDSWPHWMARP